MARRELDTIGAIHYSGCGGAMMTGLLGGVGSSANPALNSTADKSFFLFHLKSSASSGTSRAHYCKLYLSGGAGGESGRFVTVVSNAAPADTVNGMHNSLDFGTSAGNVTGLGTATRNTLHIPNRTLTGTTAAVMAELYSNGSSSAIGGVTSLIRGVNDGNSTGKASVDSNAYFAELSGFTAGSGKLLEAAGSVEQALKVRIGASTRYLPVLPATTTGIVFGVGSSSAYYNFGATADKNAMEFRFTTAATSGTARGIYNRLNVTGGAGGESLRSYTSCENNTPADTVNGAHLTLAFGSSAGNVTGMANATRNTLMVPNRTLNGTCAAVMGELWADGASSDVSNTAFFRASLGGDSSGVTTMNGTAALLAVDGITIGSAGDGKVVDAISGDKAVTHLAKIKINNVAYYIMLRNAV